MSDVVYGGWGWWALINVVLQRLRLVKQLVFMLKIKERL